MILVCIQHLHQALNMIFLPHIQSISNDSILLTEPKCRVCGKDAHYNLDHFIPERKKAI
ncbi:hypothetical protein JOC85_003743 [Bacillus mesophilus]|uniref:Uncharacterized protein n=1 Tax=Bacillus mesophilus TaxID=1808955 RepID=A0A6M0QAU6_9BACI|nr:hypothetical protein [Bacillus mesophilus]MBM7662932.1 hypothetical protein [Bacillus mesophilus]NEY73521.1 hypothetical protein [Bacillus mesophilus]